MSKVFKGVKKIVKSVVKPLKKIAPIALPILAATVPIFAPFGIAAGSPLAMGLGSFAGNLIGGQSFIDSLKGAAIAGATSGLFKGIKMGGLGDKGLGGFLKGTVDPSKATWLDRLRGVQKVGSAPQVSGGISEAIKPNISDMVAQQRATALQNLTPAQLKGTAHMGLGAPVNISPTGITALSAQADPSIVGNLAKLGADPISKLQLTPAHMRGVAGAGVLADAKTGLDAMKAFKVGQGAVDPQTGISSLTEPQVEAGMKGLQDEITATKQARIATPEDKQTLKKIEESPEGIKIVEQLKGDDQTKVPFYKRALNFFNPMKTATEEELANAIKAQQTELAKMGIDFNSLDDTAKLQILDKAKEAAKPTLMQKWGPSAGLMLGAYSLFKPKPEEVSESKIDLSKTTLGAPIDITKDPERWYVQGLPIQYESSGLPSLFRADGGTVKKFGIGGGVGKAILAYGAKKAAPQIKTWLKENPMKQTESGGAPAFYNEDEIDDIMKKISSGWGLNQGGTAQYPRRLGMIQGEGTEKSDSIPAMLSNNEFVFTADAVRGAGGGSVREGAKKMYAMMHNLERKGQQA